MTRSRRKEVRKTPSSLKTMTVSEFVRGGLYDIDESTVVVTHGEPMGMWIPRGQYETLMGVNGTYYASSTSTSDLTRNFTGVMASAASPQEPVDVAGLNKAVKQMQEYIKRLPKVDEGGEGSAEEG
jgi:hypothetical protein